MTVLERGRVDICKATAGRAGSPLPRCGALMKGTINKHAIGSL